MFALIRKIICGTEISEEIKNSLTPEMLPQLYALSKSHDMAHIVAQGLFDLGILGEDEFSAKFQKQQMLAVYRYQKINYELRRVCSTLDEEKISFVPLKGSVIRRYYPEPWMRTSCDIDILVHEEDLKRASLVLSEKLAYENKGKSSHDISFFSQNGIHVELHYDTVEEGRAKQANRILSDIWEYAVPQNACGGNYILADEMFYFYHIAHMAKHFEEGGCGVRPFLDLWILDHCIAHDQIARDSLLEQGGLLLFANASRRLSAVWFDCANFDETTEQLQAYILQGGVYGVLDNRVAAQQKKQGGKIRYVMSRIFLSYDALKYIYPVLKKHRWLMPIMQICRWFRLLRKDRMKRSIYELNVNKTMSQDKIYETSNLFTKLGL